MGMNNIENPRGEPQFGQEFARQTEVIRYLGPFVESKLSLLLPIDKIWQPSDLLPDSKSERYSDEVLALRESAKHVSDAVFAVLVGNTITEEALPAYMTWLNRFPGVSDESGTDQTAWAKWSRGWTAEENRHGEVLSAYLRYSGRVDMRSVEVTTQRLINNGFNPAVGNNVYMGIIFTSFQESATQISHGNVAKRAFEQGDKILHKICASIAGDEGRHAMFYQSVMREAFRVDPEDGLKAFRSMMKEGISMPGSLMTDNADTPIPGRWTDLFNRFATVAVDIGVYTPTDYVNIFEGLIEKWGIECLSVDGDAAEDQEYIIKLLKVAKRAADRSSNAKRSSDITLPWVDSPIHVSK